jgi:muconolactone delta-isomerase
VRFKEKMKILAIEREVPGLSAEDFKPHLTAEAARAWELYQAGVFRELYFRQDRPEAVLILECANVEEAEDVLNTLPLVKTGLITFEVMPLVPYPGFARLFAEDGGTGYCLETDDECIPRSK